MDANSKKGNIMDAFFPKLGTMARFGLVGVILAAFMGAILWANSLPVHDDPSDSSPWLVKTWAFVALWAFVLVVTGFTYLVMRSENVTPQNIAKKDANVMRSVIISLAVFVLIWGGALWYTVASINNLH